ncbi:MAG: AAA family ATPase, partial [Flavisolibacter sp.]|nr:AAA family ATPase [Flavisolibacter sp.]
MSEREINHLFSLAAGFVNSTSQHLFLTGKAGTGKTTFLRYIRENTFKKIAVVAPTGVAAVNAGGVTMHSFFQLPRGTYLPVKQAPEKNTGGLEVITENTLLKNIRFNSNKREIIRELELLVIDEVSMLRADMLDATDAILRHIRRLPDLPFGGVQMLYIGDLFQLPPVVNNTEWQLLKEHYKSPFFFDAQVLQQVPPLYIELKKIYRQSDEHFIHLLNNIRNNEATKEDLQELHRHYNPQFVPPQDEKYIILTSHNNKADHINDAALKKLPGKLHCFEGSVKDDFNEKAYPVEKLICLKEGAQIMLIKNDKGEVRRYYNGKIGTVSRIADDKIYVTFPGERGELELEKETWKNIRYQYSKEKDVIEEEELGSYTQYPIRLAWAITIHKSQGLTFDNAIIDAGESFAAGQVYVALSRLTTIDGLVLFSRIHPNSIYTDERVLHFSQSERTEDELWEILQEEQKKYVSRSLIETFNWQKLIDVLQQHREEYQYRQFPGLYKAMAWADELVQKAREQEGVAQKFAAQLERLLGTAAQDNYTLLHQRIEAAASYFSNIIDLHIDLIQQHASVWQELSRTKKYIKDLSVLQQVLKRKKLQMQHASHITAGLAKGLDAVALLQIVEEQRKTGTAAPQETAKKESSKLPKGQTRLLTLELFRQGKRVEEIAAERNLSPITIESHLAACVETGEIEIHELVPESKIDTILKAIEQTEGAA